MAEGCSHTEMTQGCDWCVHRMVVGGEQIVRTQERKAVVDYLRCVSRRFAVLRTLSGTAKADVLEEVAEAIEGHVHLMDPVTTSPSTKGEP